MADVSTEIKYGQLTRLSILASRRSVTVLSLLEEIILNSDSIQNGAVVISAGGNGQSFTLQIDPRVSPSEAFALFSELHRRYAAAKALLIAGDSARGIVANPTPTDADIVGEMMSKLSAAPIRRFQTDFSCLTR